MHSHFTLDADIYKSTTQPDGWMDLHWRHLRREKIGLSREHVTEIENARVRPIRWC